MKLVFMLEEPSMKAFLDILLPRFLPKEVSFQTIPHTGKSDLIKSIPHKLRAWQDKDAKFIIVHDQDSANCFDLKQKIQEICNNARPSVLVRIACKELEAWYFGDLYAVSRAYSKDLLPIARKRKYRMPDMIENPKAELRKFLPEHQQINGARLIAPLIDIEHNSSHSFQTFISGVRRIVNE
jgi:hypothetical protein